MKVRFLQWIPDWQTLHISLHSFDRN